MVHGFSDQGRTGWIQHYRDRYLESADVNVISVHWYNLCTSPWYSTASKNAKYEKFPKIIYLYQGLLKMIQRVKKLFVLTLTLSFITGT